MKLCPVAETKKALIARGECPFTLSMLPNKKKLSKQLKRVRFLFIRDYIKNGTSPNIGLNPERFRAHTHSCKYHAKNALTKSFFKKKMHESHSLRETMTSITRRVKGSAEKTEGLYLDTCVRRKIHDSNFTHEINGHGLKLALTLKAVQKYKTDQIKKNFFQFISKKKPPVRLFAERPSQKPIVKDIYFLHRNPSGFDFGGGKRQTFCMQPVYFT